MNSDLISRSELIKAFTYDRRQYENGYQKGFDTGYYKGYETAKREILELLNDLDSYSVSQIQALITLIQKLGRGTTNDR